MKRRQQGRPAFHGRLVPMLIAAAIGLGSSTSSAQEPSRAAIAPPEPAALPTSAPESPAVGSGPDTTGLPSIVTRRPADAQALLAEGIQALSDGDRDRARTLYRRLVREHPSAPQIWALGRLLGVEYVRETLARTRSWRSRKDEWLSAPPDHRATHRNDRRPPEWEGVDYVLTSFTYGLGIGIAYDVAWFTGRRSEAAVPVAVGAMSATTALAGIYLGVGQPDRGDLALTLTIGADLPLTAMLIGIIRDDSEEHHTAAATALAGTAAIPIAALAAHNLTVDAGAMTLAREAGFWGMVLGAAGTSGFGAAMTCKASNGSGHCFEQGPSGRTVAIGALAGLYGGLALGALVGPSDGLTVERVRLATLGGYAGALTGALAGIALYNDRRALGAATLGALLGLGATFALASDVDASSSDHGVGDSDTHSFIPALMPVVDVRGRVVPGVGVSGPLF